MLVFYLFFYYIHVIILYVRLDTLILLANLPNLLHVVYISVGLYLLVIYRLVTGYRK